jgi:hypothetical protein
MRIKDLKEAKESRDEIRAIILKAAKKDKPKKKVVWGRRASNYKVKRTCISNQDRSSLFPKSNYNY